MTPERGCSNQLFHPCQGEDRVMESASSIVEFFEQLINTSVSKVFDNTTPTLLTLNGTMLNRSSNSYIFFCFKYISLSNSRTVSSVVYFFNDFDTDLHTKDKLSRTHSNAAQSSHRSTATSLNYKLSRATPERKRWRINQA
jgi:hypothetical protein